MRKLLGKYILLIMVIFNIFFITLFSAFIYEMRINEEKDALETVVNQVESIVGVNSERDKGANTLFVDDYVNRAKAIAKLIDVGTNNNPTNDELREYAKEIEVADIFFVDKYGSIVASSDNISVGLNFYSDTRLNEFIPVIESKEPDAYYVQKENAYSMLGGKKMIYIGVKLFGTTDGMVQIAVYPDKLDNYIREFNVSSLMKNMPTRDNLIIFVADLNTGELKGATNISEESSYTISEENLNILKYYNKDVGRIEVKGVKNLVYSKEFNDYLIVGISELESIVNSIFLQTVFFGILALCMITIVICSIYKLLSKFIISDMERLVESLELFLKGNLNVKFDVKNRTELYQMAEGLNRLVKNYDSRAERISGIVSAMGNRFGIYEYNYSINHLFFSDNLPDMFEISKEEFERAILNFYLDEDGNLRKGIDRVTGIIETYSGRKIKVERMQSEGVYYALLRDVSAEIKEKEKVSQEMRRITNLAEKDSLTGIYNREKSTELINEFLDKQNDKGVLLLFDLDNFKRVNDEKGHPEGDRLLKQFSSIIENYFREEDVKARLGGDEFIVFIPNKINKDVLERKLSEFLEVCRKDMNSLYKEQNLSVSIGVAYIDINTKSYTDLYKSADSAMYKAKRLGKGRYYINEPYANCMETDCNSCKKDCSRKNSKKED